MELWINGFVIILFFAILLLIGKISSSRVYTESDYILAGRRIKGLPIALSVAATDMGGSSIIGTAALAYTYGLAGGWWDFAAVIPIIILSLLIKKLFKGIELTTIPEILERRYDLKTRLVAACLHILSASIMVSAQTMVASIIITSITGIPRMYTAIIATIIFVIYTAAGGLVSVIWTDVFSYVVMIASLLIALPFAFSNAGGISNVIMNSPEQYYNIGAIGWGLPITWMIMNLFHYVTFQHFYQRIKASKDERTARFAYTFTGINYIFYGLIITLLGICTYHIQPGLSDSSLAIPTLITRALPVGIQGLLMAAILASTMSSSSSYLNGSAAIFTIDVYKRILNPRANDYQSLYVARISTIVIAVVSLTIVSILNNVVSLIYLSIVLYAASVFFPLVLGIKSKFFTANAAFWSILVSGIMTLILEFLSYGTSKFTGLLNMDTIYAGAGTSLLILTVISLIEKRLYHRNQV